MRQFFKHNSWLKSLSRFWGFLSKKSNEVEPPSSRSQINPARIKNEIILAKQLSQTAIASTLADYHLKTWHRQYIPCIGSRPGLYLSVFPGFHIGALSIIICQTANKQSYLLLTEQQRIIKQDKSLVDKIVWEPPAGFLNAPHEHRLEPNVMEDAERAIELYFQLHPNLTQYERHEYIERIYQEANEAHQNEAVPYERDHHLVETAIREAAEETGIDKMLLEKSTIQLLQGHCFERSFVIDYLFIIECDNNELPVLNDKPSSEVLSACWVPLDSLRAAILDNRVDFKIEGDNKQLKSLDIVKRIDVGLKCFEEITQNKD